MIKLTDEQIIGFVDTHVGGPTPSYPLDGSDWINFARAIEAEVLRLNGICMPDAGTNYAEKNQKEAAQRARMNARFANRPSIRPNPDFDLPQAYSESQPRATGCPDTMDDTGHFSEVDMPAFLREQAR